VAPERGWDCGGSSRGRGVDGAKGESRTAGCRGDQAVNMGGWRADGRFCANTGGRASSILVKNDNRSRCDGKGRFVVFEQLGRRLKEPELQSSSPSPPHRLRLPLSSFATLALPVLRPHSRPSLWLSLRFPSLSSLSRRDFPVPGHPLLVSIQGTMPQPATPAISRWRKKEGDGWVP